MGTVKSFYHYLTENTATDPMAAFDESDVISMDTAQIQQVDEVVPGLTETLSQVEAEIKERTTNLAASVDAAFSGAGSWQEVLKHFDDKIFRAYIDGMLNREKDTNKIKSSNDSVNEI